MHAEHARAMLGQNFLAKFVDGTGWEGVGGSLNPA